MTPIEFAAKWSGVTTGERASAQSHFLDLCAMLGEPGPTQADPTGSWYAFEKGAGKMSGGEGFADVWKRGFFAWEYKGKRKDLRAAYLQLQGYRDALENPPLLVVSDMERIEVRTNFTGLSPVTKVVTLADLAAPDPSEALAVLRAVFSAPDELRPTLRARPDHGGRGPTLRGARASPPRPGSRSAGRCPLPRPDPVLPLRFSTSLANSS